MFTDIPGRFDLCDEDVRLLQLLGVNEPRFDDIPEHVYSELEKRISEARTVYARDELKRLYDALKRSPVVSAGSTKEE